jgi:hypothetical protein
MTNHTFTPGPTPNTVRAADGKVLATPEGWVLLPPGDAALTRRVKAAGDHWVVAEKKGRKVFSKGVWAPAATIERIRAAGPVSSRRSGAGRMPAEEGAGGWPFGPGRPIKVNRPRAAVLEENERGAVLKGDNCTE